MLLIMRSIANRILCILSSLLAWSFARQSPLRTNQCADFASATSSAINEHVDDSYGSVLCLVVPLALKIPERGGKPLPTTALGKPALSQPFGPLSSATPVPAHRALGEESECNERQCRIGSVAYRAAVGPAPAGRPGITGAKQEHEHSNE